MRSTPRFHSTACSVCRSATDRPASLPTRCHQTTASKQRQCGEGLYGEVVPCSSESASCVAVATSFTVGSSSAVTPRGMRHQGDEENHTVTHIRSTV
jgi:hypothetical protein